MMTWPPPLNSRKVTRTLTTFPRSSFIPLPLTDHYLHGNQIVIRYARH